MLRCWRESYRSHTCTPFTELLAFMTTKFIHHYTDLNTLALILKHRTIRFNRLDRVDDITEGNAFTRLRLEQFFFVSCWTHDPEESLPQWNMYTTGMAGVRITLPRNPFNYKPLIVPVAFQAVQNGAVFSPVPFDKLITDNFFILPMFMDEKHFSREVEYIPNFKDQKNEAITVNIEKGQTLTATITDPTRIATLKDPGWSFQKEHRFVLFITPSVPLPKNEHFFQELSNQLPDIVATSLHKGIGPNIDFFDVEISQTTIDSMTITTGPLCTEGDYLLVEALLSKYAPNGKIDKSNFIGTIRRPKK